MDNITGGELKKGKAYCLRLLSLRQRSEYEIDERLKGKGYGERARKRLLDLLKKDGLVNDLKFAEAWIDSRLRSNPKGKRALKEELKSKGIQKEIIEQAFTEKASQLDERTMAAELIKKKLSKSKPGIEKGKMFQYLLRRGIDPEAAEEAINDEVK
ncbi:MAG: regulatory protein RecX [Candidatus Omnitrophota bacterium]